MAHPWIVAAKREKDGLWSLPYIFIETCVIHKSSRFYKTIGIWKGKYACLNIVYFDLAYIRLMHKLNWIFNAFPQLDDSSNIQPKEKKGPLHIFSFRCSFFMLYFLRRKPVCFTFKEHPNTNYSSSRWKAFFSEAGKLIQSTKIVLYT